MPTDCLCVVTNVAIACYKRVSDRLAENLKNKAIACYERVSATPNSPS
ncbi:hypothetical protein [Nostoc sp. S13]|nr:hypothetical protein [Nostoc sp. S13]MDF5735397.1 hypothetical protein [Nostoc sp. S13]